MKKLDLLLARNYEPLAAASVAAFAVAIGMLASCLLQGPLGLKKDAWLYDAGLSAAIAGTLLTSAASRGRIVSRTMYR